MYYGVPSPHKDSRRMCVFVRKAEFPDASFVLQVETLIENEAEKDYLYDVLRMYHQ